MRMKAVRRNVLIALTLALGAAVTLSGKAATFVDVTTTIQNSTSLQMESDGLGPYTSFSRHGDSVTSELQPIGDWDLDLTSSKTRTTVLSLTQPVSTSNPPPPFTVEQIASRQISKCSQNNSVTFTTLLPGRSVSCPLSTEFTLADGTSWRFIMNHNNYPDTNWVTVTCTTPVGNSKCTSWSITPAQTGVPNVGKLLKLNGQFGTAIADYGDYNVSFVFEITDP